MIDSIRRVCSRCLAAPNDREIRPRNKCHQCNHPTTETSNIPHATAIVSHPTKPKTAGPRTISINKDETKYWDTQIRHAKILNWITGVAAGIGLVTLYFLNATLNQNASNLKIQQRAYVAVAHNGVDFVGGDTSLINQFGSIFVTKIPGCPPLQIWLLQLA